MPRDEDQLFLRMAVETGALTRGAADEILGALARVEQLGASSSAREIALNRGILTPAQADRVRAASGLKEATPIRRTKRLGNFETLEKIGVGGMGVVYKARQVSMDRLVALKVLPPRLARDRSFIERFLREARSAARLNHPHIVQGIDVGEADGLYYFAMEFVDGESLRDRVQRVGRLSQSEALEVARQIALALEHANAHHIIHRDIKPDNILLTRRGAAKLADLGLAKRKTDAAVTQMAAPLGTPLYMSPEQARGEADVDARSDLYSLGATLYHAVVGSPPFTGPSPTAIITKHLFEKPRSPRAAAPELTEGFCSVLLKMLAKEPSARYQSATELLEDVNRLISGRAPIRAAPRPTSARLRRIRRRPGRSPGASAFAAAAIFILSASAWLLYSALASGTEPPQASAPPRRPREAYPRRARPRAAPPPQQQARAPEEPQKAAEAARADERKPLEEVCRAAKRLAAEHRFAEAAELLDAFGAEHRRFLDDVSEERGLILSEALRTDRKLRAQADGLAKQGDFPGAIALYERIIGFGIPQLSARAKHEIAALRAGHREAQRRAREAAEHAYLALRLELASRLEARDYAAAKARLDTARREPALAPVRASLAEDAADLAAVESLWAAAERGVRTLTPGEKFSVGGIRGEFVRCAGGEIHVRASGLLCRKPLRGLTTQEVLALAERVLPRDKAATHFARGLFLLAEGKPRAAARAFAAGEKAGGDGRRCLALLERRRADIAEAEAEALFARVEELARAEQWQQAAEALGEYREKLAGTRSAARRAERMDELALQARLATLDVADLFHGKCRRLGNGRQVEVTYDFREPEQLADWDLRGADWALEEGRLKLVGARAVLRAPVVHELEATAELADGSGPPGEWGLWLAEAADSPPVYAVALPERIGLKAVLRQRGREVARGSAPFRLNEPRTAALAMRSRRFAVQVDGRDVLEWTDDTGQGAAPLRFGLGADRDRTVYAANVRVVAELSEPWVGEELERLRLRLRKEHELTRRPWRRLCDGVSLGLWRPEHGHWEVRDGALATRFGGSVVLAAAELEDFELELKAQPTHEGAEVRVSFRVARNGERYGLLLGARAVAKGLVIQRRNAARESGVLARFGERVDWQPGRWYDVRLVAVGSELRAELDGALLCLVRDDRLHGGTLSLDVLHGGAAFKEAVCRRLGRD